MGRELMTISGREVEQELLRLGTLVATDIGERAVEAGADVIVAALTAAAPAGDPAHRSPSSRRYGTLRSNIGKQRLDTMKVTLIRWAIGTAKAFWGYFDEFGTVHQPARPWARPAVDASWRRAVDRMGEVLVDGIEQETR